jgi:NAD(P)-dependent dehydrogenase (short-subunit alcohol dehydrogenase family)
MSCGGGRGRRVQCIVVVGVCDDHRSDLANETGVAVRVNLKEKVAFVSGASSGIGERLARVLAAAGANVVLAARRVTRLKELRAEIEALGGAAYVTELDVTDIDSIRESVQEAESQCGPLDILINNSGVADKRLLTDVRAEDFSYVFDTNVRGAFFLAQEVARRMIEHSRSNTGFRGRIINIASVAGLRPMSRLGVYSISKAAVIQMTRVQALEWGPFGINVNAICPGYIRTEMNEQLWHTEEGQRLLETLPRRRIGSVQDLDGLALLLSADESDLIHGAVIPIDDGFSLG